VEPEAVGAGLEAAVSEALKGWQPSDSGLVSLRLLKALKEKRLQLKASTFLLKENTPND